MVEWNVQTSYLPWPWVMVVVALEVAARPAERLVQPYHTVTPARCLVQVRVVIPR